MRRLDAFTERARRELQATGETVRKRTVAATDELTAQEFQIARLARDGFSNPEIGTRLFLSPRTVEWHLRKIFTMLLAALDAAFKIGAYFVSRRFAYQAPIKEESAYLKIEIH